MTESFIYTKLKNRGLVTVSGPDRRSFLQGLISNDVNLLDAQPCVYACLLSAQGKFLHDFFLTESGESIFLECEGGARAEDLMRRLAMYKLRAKIELECASSHDVYAIFSPLLSSRQKPGSFSINLKDPGFRRDDAVKDPRHPAIGYRSLQKPERLTEQPFDIWDSHRILLTIPDGSRDMIVGHSTLLECNIDRLNGISWDKGCYMGQELTARMHYRGLVKKRLQTVQISPPCPPANGGESLALHLPANGGKFLELRDQASQGKPFLFPPVFYGGIKGGDGDLRSTCGDVGLALIRI